MFVGMGAGTERALAADGSVISADEIVQRHIQALGGQARLDSVRATIMRGEYREGSFVLPGAYMAKMRPYYRTICDVHEKLGDVCEGYDGSAWEWYADPGVVVRTVGAAAAAARHGSEIFDSLVDAKARGTRIEFSGGELFAGKLAYKLHLTLADGFEKDLFVDPQTFLIVGDRRSAKVHAYGEAVKSENRFSDYREVGGVRFPFLFVETAIDTGKELNRLTVQSMTVNPALDAAAFAPPQYARSPLQQFLEQLYMERTDPVAVMNTYREFSRANPGIDTREGIEFIGYQMAKMSDFNGAVELLAANAAAHPTSASAQYGLARAYQGAGDSKHARAAFQRALELDPAYKKASDGLNALR